jgi:hypothetical protein
MAYISDRGILKNAQAHLGERWLLKLDFEDFFHSIKPADWDRAVRTIEPLAEWKADRTTFHKILFWGKGGREPTCLSIGAPTSPSISNLVCSNLDLWMQNEAADRGLAVTRYADDITVSGNNLPTLRKFERDLGAALARNKGLRLSLNEKKRGIYGPGEKKLVTGLVLTPDGSISIGRERKRETHALVHSFRIGSADVAQKMRAKGMLAFAAMAEPSFLARLREKYGEQTVKSIMDFEVEADALVELNEGHA